jgi:hypothetical protein
MLFQNFDDHSRRFHYASRDYASNFLESLDPNAIMFTYGDNDTYPLWYAQEVEGIRPDIRIINNSLLGIDWYINQLRYSVNKSDSLDVIWTAEQIEGHNREYLRFKQASNANPNTYYNLYRIMKDEMGRPYIDPETGRDQGPGSFPVSKFFIPVDTAMVRQNKVVNANDTILSEMKFDLPPGKGRCQVGIVGRRDTGFGFGRGLMDGLRTGFDCGRLGRFDPRRADGPFDVCDGCQKSERRTKQSNNSSIHIHGVPGVLMTFCTRCPRVTSPPG